MFYFREITLFDSDRDNKLRIVSITTGILSLGLTNQSKHHDDGLNTCSGGHTCGWTSINSRNKTYSGFAGPQTLLQQGVFGLYRGMAAPLATVAAFNAALFSVRGAMESILAHPDGIFPHTF